ncbi:T9SS type A sorting domain-containing protein [Fulvivirga imtechensis]|uniref:T9SS type A sorting domain-containing protein n=1 Tax=Fulvivirga imtechensis TaxID=881893 RepID=UPI0016102CEE|nr:T9SS type A sorting domain-containing protein [Fulvivirga imtechensis]
MEISIQPINLTYLSGTSLATSYCEDESITLVASSGYTNYKWQYREEGGSWTNFTPPGTTTTTFGISNIFGANYSSHLNKNIYFRYSVGNCDPESVNAVIGPYVFRPLAPKITSATATDIQCFGDTDAIITINSVSRAPIAGETFEYQLYKPTNHDEVLYSTTSTTINGTLVPEGITKGSYDILLDPGIAGCGTLEYYTIVIDGPADAITTANAGDDQTTCSSSVTLTANAVDSDETGSWSTVSGTGTISSSSSSTTTVTELGVGTNIFRWTIAQDFGCTSTDDVKITRLNITTANAGGDQNVCSPTATLNGNAPGTGENGTWTVISGSGVFSNANLRNTLVTGLSEGANTFRWIIRDNGNTCSKTDDVTITYINVTAAAAGLDQKVCNTGTTLAANAVKAGETGEWSVVNGAGTFSDKNSRTSSVSGLSIGVNTFRWTISDNTGSCTSIMDDVVITVSDLSVSEVALKRKDPTCSYNSDGEIVVTGTGGVGLAGSDYEFNLSNGDQLFGNDGEEIIFLGLSAGFYTVTITDSECTRAYSSPIELKAPTAIAVAFTEIASITCKSTTDGAIDMTPSGGTSPYTYLWSNGATTEDLANIGAGTYSVEITDANGCTFNDSYTLTEPFELQATSFISDFNGKGVSCNGAIDGSIDIDVTGGTAPYTYNWSNGEITEDLSGIGTGIYSVEITDANNCITTINSIEITEPEVLSLTIDDQLNVDCNGNSTGSITLLSTGGTEAHEYSIDGASTWQTTNTFTNLPAGDYTVDLRDANGCSTSTTATIAEPTVLTSSVFNVIKSTCGEDNGSAEASALGGTVDYSYTWRNSLNEVVSTSSTLTNVGGGIYIVTITDANGCSTTGQANISSADGAQVTFMDIVSTSCFNSSDGQASMNITGSAPFDVEWQNGETGEEATALSPGDNVVTVTDVNGCVVVEVVNIPSPTAIDYTVTSSIPSCHDSSDGSIEVQASGGSGGYSYSWNTGNTGTSLDNITSGTYSLTITDVNGCTLDTEIVLDGVDPVSLHIDNTTLPTCVGGVDGSITVSAAGGNGGYSYSWDTGETGAVIDQISAGSYEVTVTDSKGCVVTQTIDLPDPAPFTIDIGDEVEICTGSSYVIASNVDNAVYSWTSDNGFTSEDQKVTLSEQGIYSLHVTNTDGCEAEDSFTLIVSDDLLNADFLMATEAYVGDTVVIIDISWPIPDALTWQFPAEATILMENQDYAEVVFDIPGTYGIDMEVALADCQDFYSQSITILEGKPDTGGRLSEGEELIRKFIAYPNPSDGEFYVHVELAFKASIEVSLVGLNVNKVLYQLEASDAEEYNLSIDKPELSQGVYFIRLKVGGKSRVIRKVIK